MRIRFTFAGLVLWMSAAVALAQTDPLVPKPSASAPSKILDCSRYPVLKGNFCAPAFSPTNIVSAAPNVIADEVLDRSRIARAMSDVFEPKSVIAPGKTVTHSTNEIPYRIHGGKFQALIEQGLCQWQQTTIVKFRPAQKKETVSIINFWTDNNDCGVVRAYPATEAYVGGCNDKKFVMFPGVSSFAHEVGHLLGLQHEQIRSDVLTYFDIFWDKMSEGDDEQYAFEIDMKEKKKKYISGENFSKDYDFASIMHYPPDETFWWKEVPSPSKTGQKELLPISAQRLKALKILKDQVGQSTCVSAEDAASINKLYGMKK